MKPAPAATAARGTTTENAHRTTNGSITVNGPLKVNGDLSVSGNAFAEAAAAEAVRTDRLAGTTGTSRERRESWK